VAGGWSREARTVAAGGRWREAGAGPTAGRWWREGSRRLRVGALDGIAYSYTYIFVSMSLDTGSWQAWIN
jgi:hypothetical protein